MIIEYRCKNLNIRDDLYNWGKDNFIEFDEMDIDNYIEGEFTQKDEKGFLYPNLLHLIENKTETELSDILNKSIEIERKFRGD